MKKLSTTDEFIENLAGNVLRITDVDGGLLTGDLDSTNNYLMEVDLSKPVDLSEGANYKMTTWPNQMIKLKDQAFWNNNKNDTIHLFGGRTLGGALSDDGIWEYSTKDKTWSRSPAGYRPIRVAYGAHVNAPEVQAGFWVGGARNKDTNPEIQDDTYFFPRGLTIYNTTTRDSRNLTDTPFGPTQYGTLSYLPGAKKGSLVYIGGERPKQPEIVRNESLYTFDIPTLDKVWIFDVEAEKWYEQETSGDIPPPRTQFCSVTAFDAATNSNQIYVVGGANFNTKVMQDQVYTLSIPSFKWYKAGKMKTPRMSMRCELYGSELILIGGRLAFSDEAAAGCYGTPAVIWSLDKQTTTNMHDPGALTYTAPSALAKDISASPSPVKWADSAMETLYFPVDSSNPDRNSKSTSPGSSTNTSTATTTSRSSTSTAPIALITGVSIGGALTILIIVGIIIFWRQQHRDRHLPSKSSSFNSSFGKAELPPDGARDDGMPIRPELAEGKVQTEVDAELAADGSREERKIPLRAELEGVEGAVKGWEMGGEEKRGEMEAEWVPVELPAQVPEAWGIESKERRDRRAKLSGDEGRRSSMTKADTERSQPSPRLPVPIRRRESPPSVEGHLLFERKHIPRIPMPAPPDRPFRSPTQPQRPPPAASAANTTATNTTNTAQTVVA